MTAETWAEGPSRPRKVAPPLKLTSTKFSNLGGMGQREPEHQGAEQLRLAGPGRADDQAVRPHAALRGLLDVQLDRLAAGVEADRHPEPVAGPGAGATAPGGPAPGLRRCRAARSGWCSPRARPRPARRPGAGRSGASSAGQGFRLRQRQRCPARRRAPPRRPWPSLGDHVEPAARDLQPQRGGVGRAGLASGHLDQGHAVHPVAAELVARMDGGAVHDHHVVGGASRRPGCPGRGRSAAGP